MFRGSGILFPESFLLGVAGAPFLSGSAGASSESSFADDAPDDDDDDDGAGPFHPATLGIIVGYFGASLRTLGVAFLLSESAPSLSEALDSPGSAKDARLAPSLLGSLALCGEDNPFLLGIGGGSSGDSVRAERGVIPDKLLMSFPFRVKLNRVLGSTIDALFPGVLAGRGGLSSVDFFLGGIGGRTFEERSLRSGIGGGTSSVKCTFDGVDASVRSGMGGGCCFSMPSTSSSGSYGGRGGA